MTTPDLTDENPKTLALFDLGYVFRRYWHASEDEEMGNARKKTVMFIAAEADKYDAVALCKDSPPYDRRKQFADYKANREKASSVMIDQMRRTLAELERWGYKVVGVPGQEADDVIATLARRASSAGMAVDIWTPDKDIRQVLHWARTRIIDPMNDRTITGADLLVDPKFGVPPDMIPSFLALVGDKSDNMPGIEGCGPKAAAKILLHYQTLEAVFDDPGALATAKLANIKVRTALMEEGARDHILKMRGLAKLRDDLDLQLDNSIQSPRAPVPEQPEGSAMPENDYPEEGSTPETTEHAPTIEADPVVETVEAATAEIVEAPKGNQLVRSAPSNMVFERQLEPTGIQSAWKLAHHLHESRLYVHAFSSPQQILAVMLDGRARGIDATTSLRCYNVIKNRVSMSSELVIAMIMSSDVCEYFQCVESNDEGATWVTKRKGNPEPDRLTFTIEDAKRRGLVRGNGPWATMPAVMCRWRGGVGLGRMVYPDVTAGIYSMEEISDFDS